MTGSVCDPGAEGVPPPVIRASRDGGGLNWDSLLDSYEEIGNVWPRVVVLVLGNFDLLVDRDLHLALEIPHYLLEARDGLAEFSVALVPLFSH